VRRERSARRRRRRRGGDGLEEHRRVARLDWLDAASMAKPNRF
jgi:hypothetical protein